MIADNQFIMFIPQGDTFRHAVDGIQVSVGDTLQVQPGFNFIGDIGRRAAITDEFSLLIINGRRRRSHPHCFLSFDGKAVGVIPDWFPCLQFLENIQVIRRAHRNAD